MGNPLGLSAFPLRAPPGDHPPAPPAAGGPQRPPPVVRQVARGGLASLAPGQRAALAPALDLEDPAYAALLAAPLAGHGLSDPAGRANFLAAQIVRDETMAERMAAALAPWPDGGRRGLVLCGSGHMAEGLGIPPRLARRLPGAAPLAVLLLDAGEPLPVRPPSPSPGSGVVIFTEPAPSRPPAAPRLGARLVPGGEGLLIGGWSPARRPRRAGCRRATSSSPWTIGRSRVPGTFTTPCARHPSQPTAIRSCAGASGCGGSLPSRDRRPAPSNPNPREAPWTSPP